MAGGRALCYRTNCQESGSIGVTMEASHLDPGSPLLLA